MAIKSRTAVPLALLMLAVALAFCAIAQGAPTRMLKQDTTITINGIQNTNAGSCSVVFTQTPIGLVPVSATFSGATSGVCVIQTNVNGVSYITLNLTQNVCSAVGGSYISATGNGRTKVCIKKL
jgi:hypothetical protein